MTNKHQWASICSVAILATALFAAGTVSAQATDSDGDGFDDDVDNCPNTYNPHQRNIDGDDAGDACDSDADGDNVDDSVDNCYGYANTDQYDRDMDGEGDVCDNDDDGDGIHDRSDNCPRHYNPGQEDANGDGHPDACYREPPELLPGPDAVLTCALDFGTYEALLGGATLEDACPDGGVGGSACGGGVVTVDSSAPQSPIVRVDICFLMVADADNDKLPAVYEYHFKVSIKRDGGVSYYGERGDLWMGVPDTDDGGRKTPFDFGL